MSIDAKLDHFIAETHTNFDEIRSAIKFSFAEIDRRMTHLETSVHDLTERVLRIERAKGI